MRRSILLAAVVLAALAIPAAAGAVTVTINALPNDIAYIGAADIAANTGITISWTTDVSTGNFYVNVGSSTVGTNQIGSGTLSATTGSVVITPADIKAADPDKGADGKKDIYVIVDTNDGTDGGTGTTTGSANQSIPVYFDTVPPAAPTLVGVSGGENNLKARAEFAAGSMESDKGGFILYYRPKGETGDYKATSKFDTTTYTITGLENNVEYEVVAAQVDWAGNESTKSAPVYGTPVQVLDFIEFYQVKGGKEQGGFCFIATAAYGSPSHPYVETLREFRDAYLLTSAPGRALVKAYYRLSPPAAEFIRHRPVLRAASGAALLPFVGFAWLSLHPAVPLLAVMIGGVFLAARRSRASRRALLLALACAAATQLVPGTAAAESPRNMAVEIKFGPFHPTHIDDEPGLNGAKPYATIFGTGNSMMSRLQFDYILWQRVGTVCVGGGFGFWQALGKGQAVDPSNPAVTTKSSDTTVFNIVPLSLDLTYRFDWLAQKMNVPLMVFGKAGLDYDFWWVLNGNGDTASPAKGSGSGGKLGWHAGGGVGLLLDWLDEDTANDFDVSMGVNNTYLIAEFQYARIDGFTGGGFDLSSESVLFGLLFEF